MRPRALAWLLPCSIHPWLIRHTMSGKSRKQGMEINLMKSITSPCLTCWWPQVLRPRHLCGIGSILVLGRHNQPDAEVALHPLFACHQHQQFVAQELPPRLGLCNTGTPPQLRMPCVPSRAGQSRESGPAREMLNSYTPVKFPLSLQHIPVEQVTADTSSAASPKETRSNGESDDCQPLNSSSTLAAAGTSV